jgi:beta-galactosidase
MKKIILSSILSLAFFINQIQSQDLLYGVAYYHEYMPYERLDEDIKMMQSAGINVVRLAESSWALLEPEDGKFDFVWLDRVVDKMGKAGIKVIIGTPTYSIPAWMYKKHPDVLVEHIWGGRFNFGGRCNHDITNKDYLFYAERIIKKMAEKYAKVPHVIGFQIDNETKTNFMGSQDFYEGLKKYIQKKYVTIENLNKSWGLNYWSQTLKSWDELPSQKGTVFLGYKLEMERYRHQLIIDFLKWQSQLVAQYKRPEQFITHNFDNMDGAPHPGVRQDLVSKSLDIAGSDVYHGWQEDFEGMEISLAGDYFRSIKNKNYFVIETNAQTNLLEKGQIPPLPGQLRLAFYAHVASGASMVSYWHWHTAHSGAEVYWRGLLSHDLKPNRQYVEASKIGNELKQYHDKLAGLSIKNNVALLYSHDSYFGTKEENFMADVNYQGHFKSMYQNLYQLNIGTDILTYRATDFGKYKLLLVPMLYISSDSLLEKITQFAQSGGHVIFTPRSAYENQNGYVRHETQPAKIASLAGVSYQEFMTLTKPVELAIKDYAGLPKANGWAELLINKDADVLAHYKEGLMKGYPAATSKSVGKGSITYVGTFLDDDSFKFLLRKVSEKYSLDLMGKSQGSRIIQKHATNAKGKKIHFYFNFSQENLSTSYQYLKGTSIFNTKKSFTKDSEITVPAVDLEIIEE